MIVLHDRPCGPTKTPPPLIDAPPGIARLALSAEAGAGSVPAPAVSRRRPRPGVWTCSRGRRPARRGALVEPAPLSRRPVRGRPGRAQRRQPDARTRGVVLVHPPSSAVSGGADGLKAPRAADPAARAGARRVKVGGPLQRKRADAAPAIEAETTRFLLAQRVGPRLPSKRSQQRPSPAGGSARRAGAPACVAGRQGRPAPPRRLALPQRFRGRPHRHVPSPQQCAATPRHGRHGSAIRRSAFSSGRACQPRGFAPGFLQGQVSRRKRVRRPSHMSSNLRRPQAHALDGDERASASSPAWSPSPAKSIRPSLSARAISPT
jgi:hypothetical protein